MIPKNAELFLMSSVSEAASVIADRLENSRGPRVLIIETATVAEGRTQKNGTAQALYERFNGYVKVVDLDKMTVEETAEAVEWADVVHIAGGNTFALLEAIRDTDFEDALNNRADGRRLIVVGESAGALVMGKDISHAASLDNPGDFDLNDAAGLAWVPDLLVPHIGCQFYGIGEAVEKFINDSENPEIYTQLREEEVIIIDKGGRRVVTGRPLTVAEPDPEMW